LLKFMEPIISHSTLNISFYHILSRFLTPYPFEKGNLI
jgi:hypothetical protein